VNIGTDLQDIIKRDKESHQRLTESIRKIATDREWINDYFDLAKEIIDFTGLKSDDPRLVMSITQNRAIPITVGQRYILAPACKWGSVSKSKADFTISLILPLEYEPDYEKDVVVFVDHFRTNKQNVARWVIFDRREKIEFSDSIKDYWKQAVMTELKRSKRSGFKKYHEPIVYEAVMNLSYRNKLLEEVYPETF